MYPACVAEELALYALIQEAEALLEIDGEEADFDALIDEAFQDTDFLMLFDPKWDGVTDSKYGKWLGVANLEFKDWFRPFNNEISNVHPYAENATQAGHGSILLDDGDAETEVDSQHEAVLYPEVTGEDREVAMEWKCNEPFRVQAAACKVCGACDYSEDFYGPFRVTVSTKDGEERLVKVEDFMETTYTSSGIVCNVCGNDNPDLWDTPRETVEFDEE